MKKIISSAILIILGTNAMQAQLKSYPLEFDSKNYQSKTLTFEGKFFEVRAYENIVYVSNPIDTAYQKINIYIPEEYFNGKTINGYASNTAPILFLNKIGGYMPAKAANTKEDEMGMRPPLNGEMPPTRDKKTEGMPPMNGGMPQRTSTVLAALSKGYIVASAGARGRTSMDNKGNYSGKAPAGLVDLKAAIRYLKFNNKRMPGDANKIISNGTSAGGAMSALLGATGNNPDYEPYLKSLGAAKAADDVFAVSAYCPITNLDHADIAYEWQFNGINTYKKGGPFVGNNDQAKILSDEQISVSQKLKTAFPAYLNALQLKDKNGNILSLDESGDGNFKELVKQYLMTSAQKVFNSGKNLSEFKFLTISDNKVTNIDYEAYLNYIGRQKTPPAFDALDLSTGENMLFGTPTIDKLHFTDFGKNNSKTNTPKADNTLVKMMNPMYYIGQKNTITSKNWRIRHGTKDKDTSLAISIMLATMLENKGYKVNFELPWEKTHSGDYDLDELFQWIDTLCK
ncbi:MAG: alpha/beta hydrolase [Cytophagia bacterium]|nr:alpha/beta hydrolase [Cytophagia bacterium]